MAGRTFDHGRAPASLPPTSAAPLPAAPAPSRARPPLAAVIQRAQANPRSLTRADLAQLHRSIGNAAVGLLLGGGSMPNRTGLPDALKANVEAMSDLSLDDVRVHYNSPKPEEVQAHAYAQGNEIHLGPGQERHLAHEAWHVIQQKQGRVRPTLRRGAVLINDDPTLEREADQMVARSGTSPAIDAESGSLGTAVDASPYARVTQRRAVELGSQYVRTNIELPVYFLFQKTVKHGLANALQCNLGSFVNLPTFVSQAALTASQIGACVPPKAGQWMVDPNHLGKDFPTKIEPFNVIFTGTSNDENVSMTYHFGSFNNGYILTQSQGIRSASVESYAKARENSIPYSNVHEVGNDVDDVDMNTRMVADGANGGAWDARSILGGEGARFKAVRDLHQHGILTNLSRFFASIATTPARGGDPHAPFLDNQGAAIVQQPAEGDDYVACITLANLWGIWSRRFPGRYDIQNRDLADFLRRYYAESSDRVEIIPYNELEPRRDFDLDRSIVY